MPNAYDYAFRCQVIDSIERAGLSKQEACLRFNISRNTVESWLRLKAETGDLYPRSWTPQGPKGVITDWDKFRAISF